MKCPICKCELETVYNKYLGEHLHDTWGNWDYRMLIIGHCKSCDDNWGWQQIDYMGGLSDTEPTPAIKDSKGWLCRL